jgi:phage gpG-like protein
MSDIEFDWDAVQSALLDRAENLRQALEDKIRQNLSGDILNVRSGALLASISSEAEDDGSGLAIEAGSAGVPYAAILEYGGKTAAHDIVAVKAKALAFIAGGAQRFARLVHHPGSTIKAYNYMGGALDDLEDEMTSGLKDAVLEALGAA